MDLTLHLSGLYKIYEKHLEKEIKKGSAPNHVAIVLDGNRRWAKRHLYLPKVGHYRGADRVEDLIDWCNELGIKIITLYALSTENLERKDEELEYIFDLIEQRLNKLLVDPKLHKFRMNVRAIGRVELMPERITSVLKKLEEVTRNYDNIYLNIAIAYGGQTELLDAVRKVADMVKDGKMDVNDIGKEQIESCLYTSHLPQPEPDMILRTSGEQRLSGFLIWQSAYSELVFMDVFWPEFRKIDLMRAIRTYQRRKRRYGK
ncbi:MAG: tritrans,polycis-undecaprenyl-diphosphate synthase [geranylgeranyl-diphosphate specific] [Candidatus Nitrosomirales archaeon]|jgi:tritrans,polycis-undecaprenyl-diphosphate synthase [geranylgeranyl-diphosphate specific]